MNEISDKKLDEILTKLNELEGLAGVFKKYYDNESLYHISSYDLDLHISFFSSSLYEKVNQLCELFNSIC